MIFGTDLLPRIARALWRRLARLRQMVGTAINPPPHLRQAANPQRLTAHFMYGLWDDGPLPAHARQIQSEWARQGWRIKLWDREMVASLLARHPEHEALAATFTRRVMVADLARLLVVAEEGGFYFDLDCRPQGSNLLDAVNRQSDQAAFFFIETILSQHEADVIGREQPIRAGIPERPVRIANFAFGARQRQHPVLLQALALIKARSALHVEPHCDYDVLYMTGPDVLTTAAHAAADHTDFIDHSRFMAHLCHGGWRNGADHLAPDRCQAVT